MCGCEGDHLCALGWLMSALPTAFLKGTAAAGFEASHAMGYLKDATGGFAAGLPITAFFPPEPAG
jgi:hypothetical protein